MEAPCRENSCQRSPDYFWHYPRRVSYPHSLPILGTHCALHEGRDIYTVYPQPGKPYLKNDRFSENPRISLSQHFTMLLKLSWCRSHILPPKVSPLEFPSLITLFFYSSSILRRKLLFLHSHFSTAASHPVLSISPWQKTL